MLHLSTPAEYSKTEMPFTTLKIPDTLASFNLFIFDLDGTLYNQHKLRRKMMLHLLFMMLTFRLRPVDLRIIRVFREQREQHKGYASSSLEALQYSWCAEQLNQPVSYVKKVIEKFMYNYPLRFLNRVRFRYVTELFQMLHAKGKKIAILSDFPVVGKMQALQLKADGYFYTTSPEIGQLKPGRKALEYVCSQMNCGISESIFIGDRDDTDGESARLAGMNYIVINTNDARKGTFFEKLLKEI
jgi:FMN phosphatase YigB (HAD superfamily)